ncbi:MAG: hypothetical protein ACR2K0_08740 [Acidimicrobiales bacterium]
MTGFQHVHPALVADGTWSVPLALTSGDWRAIARADGTLAAAPAGEASTQEAEHGSDGHSH